LLQQVGAHARVILRYADHLRTATAEHLQSGHVGWQLDDQRIPGIEKHPAHEVEALLGSAGDENLVSTNIDAVFAHPLHQLIL